MAPTQSAPPIMAPLARPPSRGVGRLIDTGLLTALVYSALTTGSVARCLGGYDSAGFTDPAGDPTSMAPTCLSVNFHPQ